MNDDQSSGPICRVSRHEPCPVCGKADWCGYSGDGRFAVCMRVAEGAVTRTRNGGYLHILRDDPDWRARPRVRTLVVKPHDEPKSDFGTLAAVYAAAVNPGELQDLAKRLGVSIQSLVRLGVGWAAEHRAWSFAMYDAGRKVRGIRLRSWAGRKWAIRGSHEGLFFPAGLHFVEPLLISEGATDAAALLDMDFEAVGRPSCTGGTRLLAELVGHRTPPGVVIVADRDGPGQRGAENLASALLAVCRSVRMICPPKGINDARAWKQVGATHQDVQKAIAAEPERSLRVGRRKRP